MNYIYIYIYIKKIHKKIKVIHDKWVPVTMTWSIITLQMEEWPPIWRVTANISNKQSQTVDKGCSSSLGVRQDANNSSP